MISSYGDAVSFVKEAEGRGVKPGLERMEALLERLEHPERHIKVIHVAGTNGKGSTIQFLRSILQENGYQAGTFTSPVFNNYNEHIQLNSMMIKDEIFTELIAIIEKHIADMENDGEELPTAFEILTAAAFYFFWKVEPVDVVLVEAGLGGLQDSTNVVSPILSIITSIGLDHTAILGSTIKEITSQKAGIIKSGIPVITGAVQREAINVIKAASQQRNSKIYLLNNDFLALPKKNIRLSESFDFQSPFSTLNNLSISMLGIHQVYNASIALMAVDYLRTYLSWEFHEDTIRSALKNVNHTGRFEKVSSTPLVYIDGAHNPEGIKTLVTTIERHFEKKYVRVVFSALKDKRYKAMVKKLSSIAFRLTFTTFDFPRAESAKKLFAASKFTNKHYRENWQKAIEEEMEQMKDNEILVITGSLYFIAAVRQYFSSTSKDMEKI
jgi:dihydrofolate synthase/folylpolyglutamate synthase